jgi:hypothetical protein
MSSRRIHYKSSYEVKSQRRTDYYLYTRIPRICHCRGIQDYLREYSGWFAHLPTFLFSKVFVNPLDKPLYPVNCYCQPFLDEDAGANGEDGLEAEHAGQCTRQAMQL